MFQSAPPAREATLYRGTRQQSGTVSIRAPRAGGDASTGASASPGSAFQSAPPAREATRTYFDDVSEGVFQSAPPAREATRRSAPRRRRRRCFNPRPPRGRRLPVDRPSLPGPEVSIRAPRAGGDSRRPTDRPAGWSFNPRPPRGRRLEQGLVQPFWRAFQSAPPAREATGAARHLRELHRRFNPRPPRGRRHCLSVPWTFS